MGFDPSGRHVPITETSPQGPGCVLVTLLAYGARRLTESVLGRIPDALLSDRRWSFLVIDDTAKGEVADAVRSWVRSRVLHGWTVLHTLGVQGHGGIQKLAFRFATDRGFDLVVVLPADGQYPPEVLGRFAQLRRSGGFDVVLASRVADRGLLRRSGMPRHLRISNRVVTRIQNALAGTAFSEFHSPYRAYAGDFLRRCAYELATNEYHFDTEILLQAVHAEARLHEFPVEVRYDQRLRRIGRIRYTLAAVGAAARYGMHRLGALCSLKYRGLRPVVYDDKGNLIYSSHTAALGVVRSVRPERILDIGCGPGFVARSCEALGARVTGVDIRPPLPGMLSEFHRADLDRDDLPIDAFSFPLVMMLDVIEHLSDPEGFLLRMRNRSRALGPPGGRSLLLLTTPNVAFAGVRLSLLVGRFNYAERGILDIEHKRLLTRTTLVRMLDDCGYDVVEVRPIPVPFQAVLRNRFGRILGRLAQVPARLLPKLFAFQFLVLCVPRPGLARVLQEAESSAEGVDGGNGKVPGGS